MQRASRRANVFMCFALLCAGSSLNPTAGADPAAGTRSAADTINTTVYVDVSCPDGPDDDVWGGIGIGFG